MKAVILEYAGLIVALIGCLSVLALISLFFTGQEGLVAVLIREAVEGGY